MGSGGRACRGYEGTYYLLLLTTYYLLLTTYYLLLTTYYLLLTTDYLLLTTYCLLLTTYYDHERAAATRVEVVEQSA